MCPDVSSTAAKEPGIIDSGVTKEKLDIIE
jgi:hypothetical protein